LLEENLGRALLLSQGDLMVFLTRPISATMLAATAILLGATIVPAVRRGRERVFAETT
jgi:TctA family transporter